MQKINIGVTGIGSLIGQAIIKSIKNSSLSDDVSICGFDYFVNTIGSHWCCKSFILPDFLKDDISVETWLEKIIEIIKAEDINMLFIGLDFELEPFARNKELIESKTGCKVMVSGLDVVRVAHDKYLTYKFLKDSGFYYPKSFLPDEIGEKNIDFPCFLKPRKSSRSRDCYIVSDMKELNTYLPKVKYPIIQELVGSPDAEYTCGVIFIDGKIQGAIALRRILKDGNTETAFFSKDIPDTIYNYIKKVTYALKPFGACNFQLRTDKDGIPKIFEINARHSGTTYIRAMFGFNEVEYIISYLTGRDIKNFELKEGAIKRYYEEMFIES